MNVAETFRLLVTQRLEATAEEIVLLFHQSVAQYEEEFERQRLLLAMTWKPRVKLHRIGRSTRSQPHGCFWFDSVANSGVVVDRQSYERRCLDRSVRNVRFEQFLLERQSSKLLETCRHFSHRSKAFPSLHLDQMNSGLDETGCSNPPFSGLPTTAKLQVE